MIYQLYDTIFFYEKTLIYVFLILAKNSCTYFMGGLPGWCIM